MYTLNCTFFFSKNRTETVWSCTAPNQTVWLYFGFDFQTAPKISVSIAISLEIAPHRTVPITSGECGDHEAMSNEVERWRPPWDSVGLSYWVLHHHRHLPGRTLVGELRLRLGFSLFLSFFYSLSFYWIRLRCVDILF